MCRKVTCRTCGKATWAGCGQHIEQALAGVPRADRCSGHKSPGHEKEPARGLFAGLFGR